MDGRTCIKVSGDSYRTLSLTDRGRAVLRGGADPLNLPRPVTALARGWPSGLGRSGRARRRG